MSEIFSRILQLAEYYGVTKPSEFAKRTGFSHQTATNYLKGHRHPNAEAIKQILQSFNDVSPDWLISGNGSMIVTENKVKAPELTDSPDYEFLKMKLELYEKLLEAKDQLIAALEEKKRELEQRK